MEFFKKHLILTNILLIVVCGLLVISLAMFFLNRWTAHGVVRVVPDIQSLSINEARTVLAACDLEMEVVDSVYNDNVARGAVVDQVPPAGNRVKPGRTVYLTINSYSPRQVTLPELVGTSVRQARATLQSLGFTDVREERVPSDYRDLVLAVKSMGVSLRGGTKLPLTAAIVVEVGEGYQQDEANDSIVEFTSEEWDSIIENAENDN